MQPIKLHVQKLIDSGFTQVEIEEKTGVTQATVSRILSGADPRYSTVEKLLSLKPKSRRKTASAEPVAA